VSSASENRNSKFLVNRFICNEWLVSKIYYLTRLLEEILHGVKNCDSLYLLKHILTYLQDFMLDCHNTFVELSKSFLT